MKFIKKLFALQKDESSFIVPDENVKKRALAERDLEERISILKSKFAQNPPSLDHGEGYAIMRGYKYLSEGVTEAEKKKLDCEFINGDSDRNYEMSLHFYKELADFISSLDKPE